MRLRSYLMILAFVCCLGGLVLEFVIFQRQQTLDHSAAQIESAMKRQQDVHRLTDHVAHLLLSVDLLFGASETYMIDAAQKQLKLSMNDARDLVESAAQSDDTLAPLNHVLLNLQALEREVDLILISAVDPDFQVAAEQLHRVDAQTVIIAKNLQRLSEVSTGLALHAKSRQAELRGSFDTNSWLSGAIYVLVVLLVLMWVARSVARPLNRVSVAADIALRDQVSFEAAIDGPVEVRALAGHISTLVHSLERAVDSRTQFLTSMSHELRTPLNGVLGMTALLLDSDLRTQDRKCLEVIESSSESLLSIVNELLDFARYENGSIELDSNTWSLEKLLREVLDVATPLAHQKHIALYLEMTLLKHDEFSGDKNRIRQVLVNLVSNAIKFTHKGSVTLCVSLVELSLERSELRFRIVDTGIGIPEDKLDVIFKPFKQSDSSTTRKYGGSGLGLAICSEIVSLMHGGIGVSSEVGRGSEFSFSIALPTVDRAVAWSSFEDCPEEIDLMFQDTAKMAQAMRVLKKWGASVSQFETFETFRPVRSNPVMLIEVSTTNAAEINKYAERHPDVCVYAIGYSGLLLGIDEKFVTTVPDPASPRELIRALSSARQHFAAPVVRQKHNLAVLLADDNPVNRTVGTKMIERLGAVVCQVNDGQEAVEACEKQAFDVVFMDVQMPIMDGLMATRKIRAQHGHQPIIIAMTANAMNEDRQKCFDAGMNDFLAKPIRIDALDRLLGESGERIEAQVREQSSVMTVS